MPQNYESVFNLIFYSITPQSKDQMNERPHRLHATCQKFITMYIGISLPIFSVIF